MENCFRNCANCKGETVRRYEVKLLSPNGTPVRVIVCATVYHKLTDKD